MSAIEANFFNRRPDGSINPQQKLGFACRLRENIRLFFGQTTNKDSGSENLNFFTNRIHSQPRLPAAPPVWRFSNVETPRLPRGGLAVIKPEAAQVTAEQINQAQLRLQDLAAQSKPDRHTSPPTCASQDTGINRLTQILAGVDYAGFRSALEVVTMQPGQIQPKAPPPLGKEIDHLVTMLLHRLDNHVPYRPRKISIFQKANRLLRGLFDKSLPPESRTEVLQRRLDRLVFETAIALNNQPNEKTFTRISESKPMRTQAAA